MEVTKDGVVGKLYGVSVAIEHNADGSVTLCKELVQELLEDKKVPLYIRKWFKNN